MPIVADAAVAVRGDLSQFNRDLTGAGKSVDTLGVQLKNALSPKNLLLGGGALVAGTAAISFLSGAVDAASNLNETVSKTGQIFGQEALPGLEKWAETAATTFGQSKQQALDAASNFATFGKSAGLAGNDLTGFSKDLTILASDLASFNNTSPEEAVLAIGAALRGESEPIRRYGVLLNEATLKQRAMALGIIRTTNEALTPQQRVLAAQAEILAQTSDAQGDFARTSDGLANTQRTNAAKWDDAMAKIGKALLPVVTTLAELAGHVIPLLADVIIIVLTPIRALTDAFAAAGEVTDNFAMDFGDMGDRIHRIADLADADFQAVKDSIKRNMTEAGMSFEDAAQAAEEEFGVIVRSTDEMVEQSGDAWMTYQNQIRATSDAATAEVRQMTGSMQESFDLWHTYIVDLSLRTPGDIAQALEDGRDAVKQAADSLARAQAESLEPSVERAQLIALLTGDALAQGLLDRDPIVRRRAQQLRDSIYARLGQLGDDAWTWGNNVGNSFGAGLIYSQGYVNDKATQLKRGVQRILEFAGSPAYTHSREIGEMVGLSWGEGLAAAISRIALPMGGVDAMLSGVAMPVGGAAYGGIGATLGPTYQLNVNGVQRTVATPEEAIDELHALGAFGEGRL